MSHLSQKTTGFLAEFRKFIARGNVMDLAVGVIIGAAFQNIVTSLTNDVLNPLLGIAFSTDFSNVVLPLPNNADPLRLGAFISAVLNFVIMAFVLFCLLKGMNKLASLAHRKEEAPAAPTTKKCPYCKTEIAIDATRCPHCTSQLLDVEKP